MKWAMSWNAALAIAVGVSAHAQQDIWTGAAGDGLWSNGANWSTGAAPTSGQTAAFAGAAAATPVSVGYVNQALAGTLAFSGTSSYTFDVQPGVGTAYEFSLTSATNSTGAIGSGGNRI